MIIFSARKTSERIFLCTWCSLCFSCFLTQALNTNNLTSLRFLLHWRSVDSLLAHNSTWMSVNCVHRASLSVREKKTFQTNAVNVSVCDYIQLRFYHTCNCFEKKRKPFESNLLPKQKEKLSALDNHFTYSTRRMRPGCVLYGFQHQSPKCVHWYYLEMSDVEVVILLCLNIVFNRWN